MRTALWILLAWLGVTFWTGLAARLSPGHVFPDAAIIAVCFVALHHKPIPAVTTALVLGYLIGRQAAAPVGLHETALVSCAIVVYLTSGKLAGSGAFFFAPACGAALIGYHLLLFAALLLGGGQAGFASWATAVLLPNAGATGLLALISYRPMLWLESRLAEKPRAGLQWG